MFRLWYAATCLAMETSRVVGIRLAKIITDESPDWDEMSLMVAEKVTAFTAAAGEVAAGATLLEVIDHYRNAVAANAERLAAAKSL